MCQFSIGIHNILSYFNVSNFMHIIHLQNIFFNDINKSVEDNEVSKVELDKIFDNIIDYSGNTIDREFLVWISDKYSDEVLIKLEKEFSKQYSINSFRSVIGHSYYVLQDKYNGLINEKNNIEEIVSGNEMISFVGDVSLADNWYIMPKYDERNKKVYGILSEEVVHIMNNSSVMIANNEFTISNRGEKLPNKYYTFRGSPSRLSIYDEMGVDLVTLANNHVYDFGEVAFYDTLESLNNYGLPYIGAGKNLKEASRPYYFIVNGYKIGFVNATRAEKYILTPGASENSPGVFRCYDPSNFINVIKEVEKESDYVVALVHWGREDSTVLEDVQLTTSKQYIDAGADLIVGTHAHNLQGIDFYNDKAIVYNLGDFIFNNETKDTAIFQFKINDDGSFEYYFIPCKEKEEYTWCEVQISYAIGIEKPLAIYIKTNLGDIEIPNNLYEECKVKNIIRDLTLQHESYEERSKYGHFKN